ncbi:Rho GTPase activation protein [Rhypophila decipiens]
MDGSMGGHGTADSAPFDNQLSAALSNKYKSASDPVSHPFHRHPRDEFYSTKPGLGLRNGYMTALIDFAEGEVRGLVDDDVDADSDDASDTFNSHRHHHDKGNKRNSKMMHMPTEARGVVIGMSVPGTTTGAGTVLVPAYGEAQFSSRITQIPYDLPELLPDKETTSTATSLTSPPTPILVDDIFRPLSSLSILDLKLNLSSSPPNQSAAGGTASGPSPAPTISKTADSGKHASSRRFSFEGSDQIDVTKARHTLAHAPSASRSLASAYGAPSLRTRTAGSSDEPQTSQVWGAFSRLRNSVRSSRLMTADEDFGGFIERRSLTPHTLVAPTTTYHHNESTIFEKPLPHRPSTSSSIGGVTDTVTISSSSQSTRDPGRGSLESGWRFGRRRKPKAMGDPFGVDLLKSIEIAPARIRISHNGRSNSHRKFPLSIHKCCEFIKDSGTKDPSLFSSPGNAFHLDALRRIFTTAPDYGENFTFDGTDYTIHDAARIILIYLTELPKPLVPRSVLKSWILLARQHGAIEPPCPMRIETGLDFWTEALNRLPLVNRNLVKNLLGLFAQILTKRTAEGEIEVGDANARQMASAVARAMFHTDDVNRTSKTAVHPTLALAFMIKKRGEYIGVLEKEKAKSKRRDSNMFLPTTEEILQWKAPPSAGK